LPGSSPAARITGVRDGFDDDEDAPKPMVIQKTGQRCNSELSQRDHHAVKVRGGLHRAGSKLEKSAREPDLSKVQISLSYHMVPSGSFSFAMIADTE
jgi:hypothetical protein